MQPARMILPLIVSALAAGVASCAATGDAKTSSVVAQATPIGARAGEKSPVALEVVSAQFGVFGADAAGRRVLFETDKFPAVTGAPYGWYIIFKTDRPTVVWREEFELPQAPPSWGPGEAMGIYSISPDRKTAVTERIIPTRLGFIANEWRYAPDDPTGAHAMRVYIDGKLVREFKFDIEDGPGRGDRGPRGRAPTT
ncbi:MAG: hypothetical protein ACREJC_11725 [Tepidisphaeraceae bacterium]